MPRPPRIEYENAYYHVMNRGRGRQEIFHGEAYYQRFLSVLSETHQRFGLEIYAWTVNSKADMQRMIDLGVDTITTDYPGRLYRLLNG